LLFVIVGCAIWLSIQEDNVTFWVRHTLQVENRLSRVQSLATDAETGQRGYLLTAREAYLAPYQYARQTLIPEIDALAKQTADNQSQQELIVALRSTVSSKLAELQSTIDLRAAGHPDQALAIVNNDSGAQMMERIRDILQKMRLEEDRLLKARSESARGLNFFANVALIAGAILVLIVAFAVLRDSRRRLIELESSNRQLRSEIAERATAEGQVRQLQKIQAIGQLTGGIAHDFNNMLAVVVTSLDMARRRLSGAEHPRIVKYLDYAMEGAQRAVTLTARLLAFARQQPLEPKAFSANQLVTGMLELLRHSIGERIKIETVLSGGLWPRFADPAQLESAILNLAVNARDAMPDGGKLTIETANSDLDDRYARANSDVKAGQYVLISVTDTGSGMAPEVVERAFDPFFTTKDVGQGTGLGLSQVFGFVKQSGGHVKIYSEIGVGSTVKIYLPRYTGPARPDLPVDAPAKTPLGHAEELVLVVEDDPAVRAVSVNALRELGYAVIEASGPTEALQIIDGGEDVLLLFTDVVMPEMNGRQLVEKALAIRPGLKVLYTTGYTRNAIVHNGAVDPDAPFLSKPFTIDHLANKVREVLDKAQSDR
jgi:signal transduction histidine kinase/ActR/RegA family two-component response regulator